MKKDETLERLATVAEDLRRMANYIELMLNRVESLEGPKEHMSKTEGRVGNGSFISP